MTEIPPYPLYNRTYRLYRLSPLYHGDAPLLTARALRTHANRLGEQLKGDRVRGVQVDFGSAADTARLGPLEHCSWELLGDEDAWIDGHGALGHSNARQHSKAAEQDARGIEVRLEYETQSYTALLLRGPHHTAVPHAFSSLPLLLVSMAAPVRDVFLHYLRTAFDAHVAPLALSSAFITASLETYLRHLAASTSTQSIPDVVRQLSLQLAFPATTSLLKHVDMTLAAADVPGFVTRGKHAPDKPFTAALARYLAKHLALDLRHPNVHISRVSCHSFHLATDRLKLTAPDTLADTSLPDAESSQDASASQLAVEEFVASLVREAAGSGRFLPDGLSASLVEGSPASSVGSRAATRKRGGSGAAPNGNKRAKSRTRAVDEDMDDL